MIKIKSIENTSEKIAKCAEWLGLISMTVATLTGLAELPTFLNNHSSTFRAERAEFALVAQTSNTNNPLLREKDESGPHYVTYGTPRTVSRSGRR
jgi:hypothetical protein